MAGRHTAETARGAGRPRSARAEKAIIEATLDLIGEGHGPAELSIEAIAARAGVGKTTIYRRWSNKEDLIVDALATVRAPLPPFRGRSFREDLVSYLTVMRRDACDARSRRVLDIAMSEAERHPRLVRRIYQAAIEPRRAAVAALVARGVETGELRPDLDVQVALSMITGTVMWYMKTALNRGEEIPEDLPERIADHLLAGLAPR